MNEKMKNDFIDAIHKKKKLLIKFYSKEDSGVLTRTCAPMDYGPSRRAKDQTQNRFHFWDYTSDKGSHTLSLLAEQLLSIEVLDTFFNPKDFVTWDLKKSPWYIHRNWEV